jgi:glycosyltransferase involved in cell wall biosynthesis
MRFHFYSPIHFEQWDHRSPDSFGIGGSETAVVELAARLAYRGHEVTVYAPLRADCPEHDRDGARWLPLEEADFSQPGVWVLSRCPDVLDHFSESHSGQQTWLVCQDVFYPHVLDNGAVIREGLTPERSAKLDRCLPLCSDQERFLLEKSPELTGKTFLSTNGVRTDLVEQIETEDIVRDPYKIVFTSSPDRGLATLLKIFKRAREFEPRLNLAAAYGFDNIKKCKGRYWINVREEIEKLMDQPGVTWMGRIGQPDLYRQFVSAGMWVYPTTFTETSCCTCMEAQALGAVPITNPIWALRDNVRYGIFLEGNPTDEVLLRTEYAREIHRLCVDDAALQRMIRGPMMEWARKRFDWERVVDQYERFAKDESPVGRHAKVLSAPGHTDWVITGYAVRPDEQPLTSRPPKPLDCNFIVTSVDRAAVSDSPNHVQECLAPLIGKTVHVFPDCGSDDYLGSTDAVVHLWSSAELVAQDRLTKGKRAGFNYVRCLTMDRTRDALILEDDCVLADDWESQLTAALARIPEENFILAVWHAWDWTFATPSPDIIRRFHNMLTTPGHFWSWAGTNAVYYPASVLAKGLPEFIDKWQRENPNNDRTLYDGLVGIWAWENEIPIYLMTPPAAENVGTVTAIEWDKTLRGAVAC